MTARAKQKDGGSMNDRSAAFMVAFGLDCENIMDAIAEVVVNGGNPTCLLVGPPRLTLHAVCGLIDVLVKEDMKPGQVIIK